MSSTPLMSEYPQDKKDHAPPLDEHDVELTVGQPAPRQCFWSRFRCCKAKATGEPRTRSPIRRAIRWILTFLFVLGVVSFFSARRHMQKGEEMHPIICEPITETSTTINMPLPCLHTHLSLHPSLTSNDVKFTHSDKVANHSVSISFDLPEDKDLRDDNDEPKYFACRLVGPKLVSIGIHAKHSPPKDGEKHHELHAKGGHDGEHPPPPPGPPHRGPHGPHGHPDIVKAVSTTVTLPIAEAGHPRSISLRGLRPGWWHNKFGGIVHGCMKRRIRMAIAKAIREENAAKAIEAN